MELFQVPEAIEVEVKDLVESDLRKAVSIEGKLERYEAIDICKAKAIEHFENKSYENESEQKHLNL